MRVCRTPALGAKMIQCVDCGHQHYIYLSCGSTKCSICQTHKRDQWMERMSDELYDVPYVHLVTTLPEELRLVAKYNEKAMYNAILRVTNQTIQEVCGQESNLGATVGMVSVLHTFGSDMKYHVHVHSLLTFGGIDREGKWRYPKRKKKLFSYIDFRTAYKDNFLTELAKLDDTGNLKKRPNHEETIAQLSKKTWSFFITAPTMQTESIELYLARYINRIAVTNSRLEYIKATKQVCLTYNDYSNQKEGQVAPKSTKSMDPLVFLHQYLQHVLPPYFHKVRRYGIQAYASRKRHRILIKEKLKRDGATIRLICGIISHMMGIEKYKCENCGSTNNSIIQIQADREYIKQYIRLPTIRSPNKNPIISSEDMIIRVYDKASYAPNQRKVDKSTFNHH